jgi:predicted metal-dependent phosphoesterase TrpH
MSPSIIDMHVHTTRGASDSSLKPVELARKAHRVGLDGVVITEHDRLWDPREVARFRQAHSLFVANGMEVSTELGHILVIGLDRYMSGIGRADELRRVAGEAGGYMIAAHPFRHYFQRVHWEREGWEPFDLTPQQAARLPLFELVDAIEVLNGGNNERENLFALEVAQALGKPGIGGSDAHSDQGVGIYVTVFEKRLETEEELLDELKAGRFYAAHGLLSGKLERFTLDSASAAGR